MTNWNTKSLGKQDPLDRPASFYAFLSFSEFPSTSTYIYECISASGISHLHRLTRLSVSGNQLTTLDGTVLDRLPNLHFLSAENNFIGSLYGIQRARLLFELYVGNNKISTTRDIYNLKVKGSKLIQQK